MEWIDLVKNFGLTATSVYHGGSCVPFIYSSMAKRGGFPRRSQSCFDHVLSLSTPEAGHVRVFLPDCTTSFKSQVDGRPQQHLLLFVLLQFTQWSGVAWVAIFPSRRGLEQQDGSGGSKWGRTICNFIENFRFVFAGRQTDSIYGAGRRYVSCGVYGAGQPG